MRIDQFNNLPPRNEIGSETRGSKNEFNAHLKRERHADPPEFSSQEVEECIEYSETLDMRTRRYDERRDRRSEQQSQSNNLSGSQAVQGLTKVLVQQAACMVAGALIVTSSYQAMVEKRNAESGGPLDQPAPVVQVAEPADTGTETEMSQEEDGPDASPAENSDKNKGDENSETNSNDGKSSTEDVNKTDVNTDVIPGGAGGQSSGDQPAGHTFELTESKELEDGSIQLTYTCTDCGETYVVIISVDPEQ